MTRWRVRIRSAHTLPRDKVPFVSADPPAPPKPKTDDAILVLGKSEHGHTVLRKRSEAVELGEMRPAQEGKPIHGELVKLTPREDGGGRLFDVETIVARPTVVSKQGAEAASAAKHGPAQVATEAYRANWDAVFGSRKGVGVA